MKIAIVISGLVRFPEQGLYFLQEIKKHSKHEIDIYAGIWSIDTLPDAITPYLKKTAVIPYTLRDELHDMLADKGLLGNHLNSSFINGHSGLISHMATCSVFAEDLKNYDVVVKWRWDVAILYDYFELFCRWHQGLTNTLLSDDIRIDYGKPYMNEVVFISDPELMIKAFTPVRERFLKLGVILNNNLKERENYILSTFISHASLVADVHGTLKTAPLRWALLRKNILDNPELIHTDNIDVLLNILDDPELIYTDDIDMLLRLKRKED